MVDFPDYSSFTKEEWEFALSQAKLEGRIEGLKEGRREVVKTAEMMRGDWMGTSTGEAAAWCLAEYRKDVLANIDYAISRLSSLQSTPSEDKP